MSSPTSCSRHRIHTPFATRISDADSGSPNFPYARQDKKDKVRRNLVAGIAWTPC